MEKYKKIILFFFILIVISGCAKRATLSGGPKDTEPPKLIQNIKTTPNFQINFYPKIIKLYFDEWITLKNKNQILISPIIKKKPEINYRGKHITIEFNPEDTLKPNTTYIINFGNSIVDFTEGNPIKNFSYIFSTGAKIDSLKIEGIVKNAYDNKPVKGVKVMLYDDNRDSVVYNSLPYYFAETDDDGKFEILYMHEGKYKVFALKEKNNNYFFDSDDEEIGFVDTMVVVKADTSIKQIEIELFKPLPELTIEEKAIAGYGKIKIKYNRKPDIFNIIKTNISVIDWELEEDSLLVWYDMKRNPDSINMILQNEKFIDTLIFKNRKPFDKPIALLPVKTGLKNKFFPGEHPFLLFNQPVVLSDISKGKLIVKDSMFFAIDTLSSQIKDSLYNTENYSLQRDTVEKRKIYILFKQNEGQKYSFVLYPGAINGVFGQTNDTLKYDFEFGKKEDYSNLTIHLDSLKKDKSYIVLLKKQKVVEKRNIRGIKRKDLVYKGLSPGKYSLEIIEDENENGRWDGGDYKRRKGAEKIYRFRLEDLKKNWNQEENIIIGNSKINDTKNRKSGEILREKKGG